MSSSALSVRPILSHERARFDETLAAQHWLGTGLVGEVMRYVANAALGHRGRKLDPLRVSIAKLRAVPAATHPAGNDTVEADIRLLQPVPGAQQTS